MKNWKYLNQPEKGIINVLSKLIDEYETEGKLFLPDLKESDKLLIFSDYGGNVKTNKFVSYSFLIITENSFNSFTGLHDEFWSANGLVNNRIIQYKGLNDNLKRKALLPFLEFCNSLNGLLFTIFIPKNLKSIFLPERPVRLKDQLLVWPNLAIQERFLRLLHFIILLVNGLGRSLQEILWISDNDDFVANKRQLDSANLILREMITKHSYHDIPNVELKTLSDYPLEKHLEKLCSVPDLVAGAIIDFVSDYTKAKLFPSVGQIATPIPHPKLKENAIIGWISKNEKDHCLKKINLLIKNFDDNNLNSDNLLIAAFRFPEFIMHNNTLKPK